MDFHFFVLQFTISQHKSRMCNRAHSKRRAMHCTPAVGCWSSAVGFWSEFAMSLKRLASFPGIVICEAPNNKLEKFSGVLSWKDSKHTLSNQKIILRGCVLRNTRWCFGMVLFAGTVYKPWPSLPYPFLQSLHCSSQFFMDVDMHSFLLNSKCSFLSSPQSVVPLEETAVLWV